MLDKGFEAYKPGNKKDCCCPSLLERRNGSSSLHKKHVTNYAATINRDIANSDMMEVVQMFNKKQTENPGFCYSFELDGENKVRSLFWTDVRSRMMYDICGDCISFDTTFLTNKYNIPFTPFVAISPHGNAKNQKKKTNPHFFFTLIMQKMKQKQQVVDILKTHG